MRYLVLAVLGILSLAMSGVMSAVAADRDAEELEYDPATRDPTIETHAEFIIQHPRNRFVAEAQTQLQKLLILQGGGVEIALGGSTRNGACSGSGAPVSSLELLGAVSRAGIKDWEFRCPVDVPYTLKLRNPSAPRLFVRFRETVGAESFVIAEPKQTVRRTGKLSNCYPTTPFSVKRMGQRGARAFGEVRFRCRVPSVVIAEVSPLGDETGEFQAASRALDSIPVESLLRRHSSIATPTLRSRRS